MLERPLPPFFAGLAASLALALGGAAVAQPPPPADPTLATPQGGVVLARPTAAGASVRDDLRDNAVRPRETEATGATVADLERQIIKMRSDDDAFRQQIRALENRVKALEDKHSGRGH